MKLGLVVRSDREAADSVADEVGRMAAEYSMDVVWVEEETVRGGVKGDELSACGAVMAIGGDGTVLEAAQYGLALDVPIIGVNLGRVGFLAAADVEDLPALVKLLATGAWEETSRMTVEASIEGGAPVWGLNDVVVEKTTSQRLVSLEVHIEDERFLTYRADGLVFAGPTGSTAYNLSAGGPIVDPSVDALLVTPVAPYSRFTSSLVLPPSTVIRCKVVHDRPAAVNVDGHELGVAQPGQTVLIRGGARRVRFVEFEKRSYTQTVKTKLRLYEGLDGDAL